MKEFKNYIQEEVTVGLVEYIDINGIGRVKAKIDSGNQGYNVIHGINLTDIGSNKVKFLTINNQTVSFEKRGFIKIQTGQVSDMRPVISLSFKLGDQFYENIPFSVADRTKSDEKVLIGEPFLKKINALIDVNKAELQESHQEPIISGKFISTDDVYKNLKSREKELQLIMSREWNDAHVCQNPQYLKAQKEYASIKEKLKNMAKIDPQYAANAFADMIAKLK